jgi:sugar lactone lactonase YvrE
LIKFDKRSTNMRRAGYLGAIVAVAAIIVCAAGKMRAEAEATGAPLSERVRVVEQLLQQSEWESARELAQNLTETLVDGGGGTHGDHREFADQLGGAMAGIDRPSEGVLIGRLSALRAIAEAATERREEARWHWYLAQNLLGEVGSIPLAQFRKSGEFLRRHMLLAGAQQYADLPDVIDPVRPEEAMKGKFQEPVRTRVVYPYLPPDLRARDRFSHCVFVQITVTDSGQVTQPVVVDGAFYPGLVYRAFDALREWRYRPAKLDGKPVAFRFVVPIAFSDDRAILPLAEWSAPRLPSLSVLPTAYTLNDVAGLTADMQSGTVYLVDSKDSRVLRMDPIHGTSRFAGTGVPGFNGEDGNALEAQLDHPSAVSYDPRTGEVFIADTRNYRVRVVSPKDGQLRTVAGVGLRGVAPNLVPPDVKAPGSLAIGHFSGDGGSALNAELNLPAGVGADPIGILFIADSGNHRIRAINRGTSSVILMGVEIEPGQIRTIAGTGIAGFSGDGGKSVLAQLAFPTKLKLDGAGNLLIVDSANQRIRRIDRQSGIIRTVAHGALIGIGVEQALLHWSASAVGVGVSVAQEILYADRFDRSIHRVSRSGDDRVLYQAEPDDGDFTDLDVGPRGELYVAQRRRVGVLYLEDSKALIYSTGEIRPLPKRPNVNASLPN